MGVGGVAIYAEMKQVKRSYWFDFVFLTTIVTIFTFLWNIREADDFAYSWPE